MVYIAAADDDTRGVAHPSGVDAVVAVGVDIDTASAAVDVADILVEPWNVGAEAVADGAAIDENACGVEDVAVLAAAEDAATHTGGAADGDIGGVDIGEMLEADAGIAA